MAAEHTHEDTAGTSVQGPLEDTADDLYENAPCGYLSTDAHGQLTRVNTTFLTWTGYRREELVGQRRFVDLLTPGGRIYHETHFAPLLQMQGTVRAIALDVVRADGSRMPVLVNSALRSSEGRPVGVRTTVFDATDRKRYETELLAARRRAEQSAAWVAAVEQVVADLAAAPGVAEVAAAVARAGTSVFRAVASAVWLVDNPGDRPDATDGRSWSEPDRPDGELLVPAPSRAGTDRVVRVSLTASDRRMGVLALRLEADPGAEELRLLQTLGQQAGQALDRARLSDEQRSVATTLQHSLLPASLPDDPRLGLSACYLPAVDRLEVGGDWYDAFVLDDDRVAVVVGDVVGRGLHAAVAMGQLRSAVRALAGVGGGPARLLEGLDRFVEGVPDAETSTVAYAELDLRDGTMRYACAGHPPPVAVTRGGAARLLWDGRSAPLGAHFGAASRPEASTVLDPGSRFALYTDGLVERRDRALDTCIDELAAELGSRAGHPFDGLSDGVTAAVLGTGPTGDDVCLLTLAFAESPAFTATVAADVSRVAPLRADLGRWLGGNGVVGEDRDATVLAVSEAVSNAIEHGYAADPDGVVEVLAILRSGVLRLRVRDRGRWRPAGSSGDRGRGLHLVRAVMEQVQVSHARGTTVTMRRTLSGEPG